MHIRNALIAAGLCLALISLTGAQDAGTERQYFKLPEMAALNLPFSDAVLVGDTLYLSGNGGLDVAYQNGIRRLAEATGGGSYFARAVADVESAVAQLRTLPEDAEEPEIQRIIRYETISKLVISGPFPETSLTVRDTSPVSPSMRSK